jgi:hypothetical protein
MRRIRQLVAFESASSRHAGDRSQERLRENKKFACAFNLKTFVQPSRENISISFLQKLWFSLAYPASSKRGVCAIVTTREAGRRWPAWHQAL